MNNIVWTSVIRPKNITCETRKGVFQLFQVEIETRESGDRLLVSVRVCPFEGNSGMAMLTQCRLTVGKKQIMIDRDVWWEDEEVFSTSLPVCTGKLHFEANLIEFLPVIDLTKKTPYRQFQVLCAPDSYYIDVYKTAVIGGSLFTEWKEKAEEGATRVVCQMDSEELKVLLEAVLKFESLVIYRRNFRLLCDIAQRYKMLTLLRAIETYLMEASIHPMRRLEYAVEMRMARLFDFALREFGSPHNVIDKVHEYLLETGGTMNDIHPQLLSSLNITKEYICIS